MSSENLANQAFMGEQATTRLENSHITLVGGGLDIESALISLIGLGVRNITHFDNTQSHQEPSFLAPFAKPKSRINWRLEETIHAWFPYCNYSAISAPPIKYILNEHKTNVIITNTDLSFDRPTIYTKSSNTHITLSTKPIHNHSRIYDIHSKLIAGSLAADEARKKLVRYHPKEEAIAQQTCIPLTNHSLEKKQHDNVLIVGAGGIGTYTALAQTLSNAQNITIIDPDSIENTNLNRQLFYAQNIGKPKAKILAQRLQTIKPFSQHKGLKKTFQEYISSHNHNHDIIFCCTDNYSSRLEVAQYCESTQTRLLEAGCTPTTAIISEYVPNITQSIIEKRKLKQSLKYEQDHPQQQTSCAHANPSVITPNLISGVLQSYFSNQFLDFQKHYHRLQRNFCFNSHLNSKFYEE